MSVSIIESSNDDADFADFADRALRARTQICPVRIQPPSPPTESSFFFGTTARDAPKLTERLFPKNPARCGFANVPTAKQICVRARQRAAAKSAKSASSLDRSTQTTIRHEQAGTSWEHPKRHHHSERNDAEQQTRPPHHAGGEVG